MDTPVSHKFLEGLPDFQTVLAMKELCNSWPKRSYVFGTQNKQTSN